MKRLAPLFLIVCCGIALAQDVPGVLNYQGRLLQNDSSQAPIDGTLTMVFRIHATPTGAAALWSESWPAVTVNSGIFSVLLGSNGSPLTPAVFTGGDERYLEIEVNGETLAPRQQLGAVGWAGQAENSSELDGLPATDWQRRVVTSCPPGSSIRAVDAAGGVTCQLDEGLTVEDDPQVGLITQDGVPRYDGGQLVTGKIFDDGVRVGVGTPSPERLLDISGDFQSRGVYYSRVGFVANGIALQDFNGDNQWFVGTSGDDDLRIFNYFTNQYDVRFEPGRAFLTGLQLQVSTVDDEVSTASSNSSPACPVGTVRTGGGCRCATGNVEKSYPSGTNLWYCECDSTTTVRAWSTCLSSVAP